MTTASWFTVPVSCGRCRASAASRLLKRITTKRRHASSYRSRLTRASAHHYCALRAGGGPRRERTAERAPRCVSGLRPTTRAGAGGGTGIGRDPSRGARDAAAGGPARRHRKRRIGTLHFKPGTVRHSGRVWSQRRPLSAAPSRNRTTGRIRRPPAGGRRAAAPVAAVILDGISRALWLHERPALTA